MHLLHLRSFAVHNGLITCTTALRLRTGVVVALLGGSVLWSVLEEEVPSNGSASFAWFVVGLMRCGGPLALVTALAE